MLVLAISPHLDDAVLSAGGRLGQLGAEGADVRVYTVFAGIAGPPFSPAARGLHDLWSLGDQDVVRHRRAEDRTALELLGAAPIHGPFLDGVYRRTADGRWLVDEKGQLLAQAPDERQLREDVSAAVRDLVRELDPALVLTCAAVGSHIDHVLARDAVLSAVTDRRVECWEDMPYGQRRPLPTPERHLRLAAPYPVVVERASWRAKLAAVDCYRSQHRMLWPRDPEVGPRFDEAAGERAAAFGVDGPVEVFWPCLPPTSSTEGDAARSGRDAE